MITLSEDPGALICTITLYDVHRLHITPPPALRAQVLAESARHLVPGTTATVLVTQVLVTPTGAVFYTPDHTAVSTDAHVTVPCLTGEQEPPTQDPRLPEEQITATVGTVIRQTRERLRKALVTQERLARLTAAPPNPLFNKTKNGDPS